MHLTATTIRNVVMTYDLTDKIFTDETAARAF